MPTCKLCKSYITKKIKEQKTCIIMQIRIMQRVHAEIYAIYEKLTLKH